MDVAEGLTIELAGEKVLLSPEKALYWPAAKALVVADMHLGKTALFRQFGVPIPAALLTHDLERLTSIIAIYQPEKLIVVGDMFHQDFNSDLQVFTEWRNTFETLQIILVQGNHDRLPMLQYRYMGIDLYRPNLNIFPFHFVHKPGNESEEKFIISGHLHPGVKLTAAARQAIKLPCFRVSEKNIVLPAFSAFTGLDVSRCNEQCDYYAILKNCVVQVNQ